MFANPLPADQGRPRNNPRGAAANRETRGGDGSRHRRANGADRTAHEVPVEVRPRG